MKKALVIAILVVMPSLSSSGQSSPQNNKNTKYCREDPRTHIPYQSEQTFLPANHLSGKQCGGDSNTPGSCWIIDWQLPGPVCSVEGRKTGGWEEIYFCESRGMSAHCEGWINGGNAPIIIKAYYELPCNDNSEENR
jgi:hypothetical protein